MGINEEMKAIDITLKWKGGNQLQVNRRLQHVYDLHWKSIILT